jgi:hypothetical protein
LRVCYQKAKQQKQKGSMKAGGSFELFFPLCIGRTAVSVGSKFQILVGYQKGNQQKRK